MWCKVNQLLGHHIVINRIRRWHHDAKMCCVNSLNSGQTAIVELVRVAIVKI